MKKLIDEIPYIIDHQLEGFGLAYSELAVDTKHRFVRRSLATRRGKVAVISGGGSGHEPLHGGYVGFGMLDGACMGEIFTSPTPDQIIACAKAVEAGAGVLCVVKNYTGDRLNFEMAVELLNGEGIATRMVLIDDDVGVEDGVRTAGRRGIGTTIVAEKIVGAAAEAGHDLDYCTNLARTVNLRGRSMGVALEGCTVPAVGQPNFLLKDNEMEVGIGIHGEPGRERVPFAGAGQTVGLLLETILADGPYVRTTKEWDPTANNWKDHVLTSPQLNTADPVIVLVNGMGGTPLAELYAVYRHVHKFCAARNLRLERRLVGSLITSLDMKGCSITLVSATAELLRWWDAPVATPTLRWGK